MKYKLSSGQLLIIERDVDGAEDSPVVAGSDVLYVYVDYGREIYYTVVAGALGMVAWVLERAWISAMVDGVSKPNQGGPSFPHTFLETLHDLDFFVSGRSSHLLLSLTTSSVAIRLCLGFCSSWSSGRKPMASNFASRIMSASDFCFKLGW